MRHRPCSAARQRRLAESARRRRSARPRNSAETCRLETALRASANLISGWGPSHRLAASFSSLPWLWEAKHRSLLARAARFGLERGAEPRRGEGAKALHIGVRQAILATEQAHRESLRLEVLEDEGPRARTGSLTSSTAADRRASCASSTRRHSLSAISPATGNMSAPAISPRTRAPCSSSWTTRIADG